MGTAFRCNLLFLIKVLFGFRCGYATLHDVNDKTQEDRMESFFLSETCKYLYLVSTEVLVAVCYECGGYEKKMRK